jgi:hypothetical protein
MSRAFETILSTAFTLVAIGATLDGWDIAKRNPVQAENMVGRCFSIPKNITSLPKQALVCAHVPGIWTEQVLSWGRNP